MPSDNQKNQTQNKNQQPNKNRAEPARGVPEKKSDISSDRAPNRNPQGQDSLR